MSFLQLRTPSFRSRLRLFFVVIVVFPMLTMAVVLFQLIVASERSTTNARLSEARTVLRTHRVGSERRARGDRPSTSNRRA